MTWRTWRARLEHLFDAANECLCGTCVNAHFEDSKLARELRQARERNRLVVADLTPSLMSAPPTVRVETIAPIELGKDHD